MTTSGTITSADTVRDIVKDALVELQVCGATEEPGPADMALGIRRLTWMLKDWQNDGVNLWRQREVDLAWPAATAEGDLSPSILDILELRLISTTERPLFRMELGDYSAMPNKNTVGTPSMYCVTPGMGGARLRLWPVSATVIDLRATISRVIEDVTDAAETLDVPQQYTRTVVMGLAANLASPFAKQQESVAVADEARRLYRIMRAADRPASYFMEGAYNAR